VVTTTNINTTAAAMRRRLPTAAIVARPVPHDGDHAKVVVPVETGIQGFFKGDRMRRDGMGKRVIVFIGLLWLAPQASAAAAPKGADAGIQLLETFQNTFIALAEQVKSSVVNIAPLADSDSTTQPSEDGPQHPRGRAPNDAPSGSGSGIIFDKAGFIVTNNHVVGDADEVEIRLSDKTKFTGKVVGKDVDTDLAVVKIDAGHDLPAAPFGDSSKIKVGQWAIAVGNPFGLDRTLTVGVISALGRENVNLSRYEDFIQTDASINPGNSGGPLFNIRGEVIGINTAIINFAQGIGFAIPSNMTQDVVRQLMAKGKVTRGWLGVGIQSLTEELAAPFGVKEGEGVLVNEVFAGDPADRAGILPGDIILTVNGKTVDTPNTLARVIAGFGPGEKVAIHLLRDGKKRVVQIDLTERKGEATAKKSESRLGLTVERLTTELAERYKIKSGEKGVAITKVEPGSPAEMQGLKEGDLIKEVNRQEVVDAETFAARIEAVDEKETVLLRVAREGRSFFVVLKLREK